MAENWFKDNDGFEEYMDDLMVRSGLPNNASNYVANWGLAIDNAFNGLSSYSQKLGTHEYGSSMEYMMILDDLTITQGKAPSADSLIMMDTTQFVKPTSTANRVYLDTELTENTKTLDYCKSLYVFGKTAATVIDPNGKEITLSPGVNDIVALGLKSGVYTLKTQCTYAGPFVPLGNEQSADIGGGMVVKQGSTLRYMLPNDAGTIDVYNSDGTSSATYKTLKLAVEYVGPDSEMTTDESVLVGTTANGTEVNILKGFDDLIQQIELVTSNTNASAQALWEIYDAAESKNQYIKPSSLIINVPGHKLSAAESKAVYIQAMKQIAQYAQENEDELTQITVNSESLGLYCFGDIYYQGKLWAQNVVFTPYNTTDSIVLSKGQNSWKGEGFAMIWAQTEDYASWDGEVSVGKSQMTDLSSGFTLDIKTMVSENEEVEQIDLTKTVIQKVDIVGPDTPDLVDDDDIKVLDATTLILLIVLELGIIIALIGYLMGSSILMIVGAIVAIIGVLFPQAISSIALGTFSWGDLVPLGWLF